VKLKTSDRKWAGGVMMRRVEVGLSLVLECSGQNAFKSRGMEHYR